MGASTSRPSGIVWIDCNPQRASKTKEYFSPSILHTPNGEIVLDFGQNIAGWVSMRVQGAVGTEVVLIHGEALDREGNFTLQNLAHHGPLEDFQEIRYILKGRALNIIGQSSLFLDSAMCWLKASR